MTLEKHPKLNNALESFSYDYCSNRFKYLYEADIQVLLSKHLEGEFTSPHNIKREQKSRPSLDLIKFMDIGKVHREYPAGILFDNVVLGDPVQLSEDQIKRELVFESWFSQPVKYAIELKLIPLYLTGVKRADDSMEDYKRFINKKLPLLKGHQKKDLEYGVQLTLFQSIEEQDEFLKNHNPKKRQKWEEWFNTEFIPLVVDRTDVDYLYLDLKDSKIKPVFPTEINY